MMNNKKKIKVKQSDKVTSNNGTGSAVASAPTVKVTTQSLQASTENKSEGDTSGTCDGQFNNAANTSFSGSGGDQCCEMMLAKIQKDILPPQADAGSAGDESQINPIALLSQQTDP